MSVRLSQHADKRIRQRGLRECDIDVILSAGSPVGDDSHMLLDQDVDRTVRCLKREIAALERLRGCRAVLQSDKLITVYRPSKRTDKRLLRRAKAAS